MGDHQLCKNKPIAGHAEAEHFTVQPDVKRVKQVLTSLDHRACSCFYCLSGVSALQKFNFEAFIRTSGIRALHPVHSSDIERPRSVTGVT